MSFDPNGFFEAISAGLSRVPPGLIAAGLLAGPTVIWLILRFANPPDLAKREEVVPEIALWLCESCRSLNNDWRDRCYHCHRPADADVAVTLDRPATFDPGVGIAVGPGLPIGDERLLRPWVAADDTWTQAPSEPRADANPVPADDTLTGQFWDTEVTAIPASEEVAAADAEEPALEPQVFEPWIKASARPPAPRPATRRRR